MPGTTINIDSKMFAEPHLLPTKTNLPHILSAIATICAETEGFAPIGEYFSRYNASPNGHPFDLHDNCKDLGYRGPPDGAAFKGRGNRRA
jgi:peptidoglycan L-alanyl-D-glutamate endopeptidase CwlK